jgi:hypothetical protein
VIIHLFYGFLVKGVIVARLTAAEKLAKEQQRFEQAKARLQMAKGKVRGQRRKDEARCKILLGWYMLETWKGLSADEQSERVASFLDFLKRDKDKELAEKIIKELLVSPTSTDE